MKKILVSGLVNLETSVHVNSFPINYSPIEYSFFGVESFVSGVGFNITKALKTLGDDVSLLTEVGDDVTGKLILSEIENIGVKTNNCIVYEDHQSATSVVFVDKQGKRKIYCDLKDIQERTPLDKNIIDLNKFDLLVMTNINFNRKLIIEASKRNLLIASDVHTLSNINDEYNQDFMKYSNILFLSNEYIINREGDFMKQIYNQFHNDIIVCGMGEKGALLYLGKHDEYYFEPSIAPLGVVSTVGAGDALFSAFIHFYCKGLDVKTCLKKAVKFAGIKISKNGASNGFVKEEKLN